MCQMAMSMECWIATLAFCGPRRDAIRTTPAQVVSRLLGEPFTVDSAQRQRSRGRGLVRRLRVCAESCYEAPWRTC